MANTPADYRDITLKGLWENNPALVQLLGLCPLLAVTGSVVNALGLGLATLLVMVGANAAGSLIRNYVADEIRLPAFVMIIASLVTCAELLMQAFTYELYEILGIFIPLIVTNCAILGRVDAFARKNSLLPAIADGFMMGMGFMLVLLLLGGMREAIGQGTLFSSMDLIFGETARAWTIVLVDDYSNFLFAILPPGAFVALGLIIAGKNLIDAQLKKRAEAKAQPVERVDRRVRVTGTVK